MHGGRDPLVTLNSRPRYAPWDGNLGGGLKNLIFSPLFGTDQAFYHKRALKIEVHGGVRHAVQLILWFQINLVRALKLIKFAFHGPLASSSLASLTVSSLRSSIGSSVSHLPSMINE